MYLDPKITESKTLMFAKMAGELRQQGRRIISLGLGEPNFDTPDHIKEAAFDALKSGMTRYAGAQGFPSLRNLVADKLKQDNGIEASPEEITILTGAKMGLYLACAALLQPGDEVINLTPCYVSNVPIIKISEPKAKVINIPLDKKTFQLDKEKIKASVTNKTKLIITNYPNNPSGVMLSTGDYKFLRDLVLEHSIYWLSDEIYERLVFGDIKHISPAADSDIREKVITVNGFSKPYSMTGWRIGYTHANVEITKTIVKLAQQISTCTPPFIQKAAEAALTGPQERLTQFRTELGENAKTLVSFISDYPAIHLSPVGGGMFGFIDISSTGFDSDTFATKLLEDKGVAVIPGKSFGDDFDTHVRISLCADSDEFKEGMELLGDFIQEKNE